MPAQQKGASAMGTIIILAIIGYAAYVGVQWVPQMIESKTVDSILSSVESEHKTDPVRDGADAEIRVIKLLQINEMSDMSDAVTVVDRGGRITVTFRYDRELNLVYKTQPMHYEKSLTLQ
jgi:hypothetical protein